MINDEKIEFNENESGDSVASEEVSESTEEILTDEATAEMSSTDDVDESVADETQKDPDITYAFRWDYSEQYAHEKAGKEKCKGSYRICRYNGNGICLGVCHPFCIHKLR